MPVYGRFQLEGKIRYAEIENETAHFIDDLFQSRARTGQSAAISELKIFSPVAPSKIFAIGLNYADHAKESNQEVPDRPLMWFKAPTSVIAHGQTIEVAYPEHRTDHECELVIIISKRCKGVRETEANDYILGYTNGQDISDRVIQRSESQWARAKSLDTYTPLGPFIDTDIEPNNLPIETFINGQVRQSSNTGQMVFKPAQLVAFLSEAITLEPGDCIMTGTPFGVGPLADGDVLETRIGTLPPLVNPVRFLSR